MIWFRRAEPAILGPAGGAEVRVKSVGRLDIVDGGILTGASQTAAQFDHFLIATCCNSGINQGLALRGLNSGMVGRLVWFMRSQDATLSVLVSRSANLYFLSYNQLLTILLTSIHASIWVFSYLVQRDAIP